MSTNFVMFIVFVSIIMLFAGAVFMEQDIAQSTITVDSPTGQEIMSSTDALNAVTSFKFINWIDIWGPIQLPIPNIAYWSILLKLLTWDYSVFTGNLVWVKFFFFIPLSAGIVFGFFIMFISAIRGLIHT